LPADMPAIAKIAKAHGLSVIEEDVYKRQWEGRAVTETSGAASS